MGLKLKKVSVKRTVYNNNRKPGNTKQYMDSCIETGSVFLLYKDPRISAAFYSAGTVISTAIKAAIDLHILVPTKSNLTAITDRMNDGKEWLDGYADLVEPIANSDLNRSTRGEAFTNIGASFLTPQKLIAEKKGNPETPIVSALNVGTGSVDAKIINGVEYAPSQVTFILVEESAGVTLSLVNGQLNASWKDAGSLVVKAAAKKGKYTHFTGLNEGVQYIIYAYAQNGKNQVSKLSAPVVVKG